MKYCHEGGTRHTYDDSGICFECSADREAPGGACRDPDDGLDQAHCDSSPTAPKDSPSRVA
jgi:hypothetical protein